MKQAPVHKHTFSKTNLVTIVKGGRNYDEYKCSTCGIEGKRYGIGSDYILVPNKYSSDLVNNCIPPEFDEWIGKRIRVITCQAGGGPFANLTPGSIHKIVTPPEGYSNGSDGVWVEGVGEPVKILFSECNLIKKMIRTKFN